MESKISNESKKKIVNFLYEMQTQGELTSKAYWEFRELIGEYTK